MNGSIVNRWWKIIQDAFAPQVCVLCGARGPEGLCGGCREGLPWQAGACRLCALPVASGEVCGSCLRSPPIHDEAVAVFSYASPVDALIRRIKFSGDLACAGLLGQLMAEGIAGRGLSPPEVLVPVPLHRGRLGVRGYNQSVELARPLAAAMGLKIDITSCVRVRATAEQSGLAASERAANLVGAFAVRRRPAADVAIVDDVMTTGHTVGVLATALKAAGVERVRVWLCARALADFP